MRSASPCCIVAPPALAMRRGHLDALHRATIKKDWVFTTLDVASIPLAFVSVYVSMASF
jgi:hypothetical protein